MLLWRQPCRAGTCGALIVEVATFVLGVFLVHNDRVGFLLKRFVLFRTAEVC